jgi:phage terminase small subunit
MPGRSAKTIDWHVANGNRRHLSRNEMETRQEHEASVKSGVKNYKASEQVMKNMVALNQFKKLKKLFKNIDCIEGLDENIINRYCSITAETDALEKLLAKMNEDVDNCEDYSERISLYKTISGTLAGANKNRDMLLKIEDRLLMNPTARIKNVPPKPKLKGVDPNADLFD